MKKNTIQFQEGLSVTDFLSRYGTEEQCRAEFFKLKWPLGFRCPRCGCEQCCELKTRKLYQCERCRHQTSLIAGTIYELLMGRVGTFFCPPFLTTE